MFTQTVSIQEIVILPLENNMQVKRRTTVTNDGEVVSTKDHYELYASDNAEVVAILQAHGAQAIADASEAVAAKVAALQAKETAEAALTAVQAELATAQARIADLEAQAAIPTPVVNEVSARQIRIALNQTGLREQVEAAVAAGGQDIKDWWNYANTFERAHPQVIAMATALGVNDEAMDQLWAIAATL